MAGETAPEVEWWGGEEENLKKREGAAYGMEACREIKDLFFSPFVLSKHLSFNFFLITQLRNYVVLVK